MRGPESRSPSFLSSQPHSHHLLWLKHLRSATKRHPAIWDPTLAKMSPPSLGGRISAKFTKGWKSRTATPHPSPPNPGSASDSASSAPEVTNERPASQQPGTQEVEGYQASCQENITALTNNVIYTDSFPTPPLRMQSRGVACSFPRTIRPPSNQQPTLCKKCMRWMWKTPGVAFPEPSGHASKKPLTSSTYS